MSHEVKNWMRHAEKDDMTLSKGILAFFVIAAILTACVYIAA